MTCARCTDDLDHCHGTLVGHLDGASECTDGDCLDLDLARHDLRSACADLLDGCHCTAAPEPALLSRAS